MEGQKGRLWLTDAFAVFLLALLLWTVLTVFAAMALGAEVSADFLLRSKLRADYSADPVGFTLRTVRLALLGDLLGEGRGGGGDLARYLQGAVPTATGEAVIHATPQPTDLPAIAGGGESQTSTPSATPDPLKALKPILECVQDNGDGTYTAYFGYRNKGEQALEIPVGPQNRFSPAPEDRGQPTHFEPGGSPPYPNAAFRVVFDGSKLVWKLAYKQVTASHKSDPCPTTTSTPTYTPTPTQTPTPEPSATPTQTQAPEDVDDPILEGGNLDPPPGDLEVCSETIEITDLHVVDPAPSAGIDWVKLKYRVLGYTSYIYGDPLTLTSGGPTIDGGWDGYYAGSILIEIDPEWEPQGSDPFEIELYAKARDNAGNMSYLWLGEYTMPASCGKSDGSEPEESDE